MSAMVANKLRENVIQFPDLKVVERKDNIRSIHHRGGKKCGQKSEVYALEIQDIEKIANYFISNEKWIMYLLFTIQINMARRIGDTLAFKWDNFYDPATGKIRRYIKEIVEEKTDKIANPMINNAVAEAINFYIDKVGCDPSKDNYQMPVFYQHTGTHKGSVLSYSGAITAIKKAARECGIEYNVGTHTPRKTFGAINKWAHPNDSNSMQILQEIYNHSDTKVTNRYIGLTKKSVDQYYSDMGSLYSSIVNDCHTD